MQRRIRFLIPVLASVIAAAGPLSAQEKMTDMPGGVRGSYLKWSKQTEQQIVSLAEAVPQDKYAWRPMDGVRSIAESFLHPASGNYILLKTIGGTLPDGLDLMKLDQSSTDKKTIVAEVQRSFRMLAEHVGKTPDSDLPTMVDFFGMKMTKGDMIMFALAHQRESLGQQIAYARMNNIVPPWTAAEMKKAAEKKEKG